MPETMSYWQRRYRKGGTSGKGSEGAAAEFKARMVNLTVAEQEIGSVLDLGCGDGRIAALLDVPDYLGVDPAPAAVDLAGRNAPGKTFEVLDGQEPRDAHLSLDVIFHLVDDEDYQAHLELLFSARRLVVIHSTDFEGEGASHVRHRNWTKDIPEGWVLDRHEVSHLTLADFYSLRR